MSVLLPGIPILIVVAYLIVRASSKKAEPAQPSPAPKPQQHHPRDAVREIFETIAFVVVLVLMLKLFVVEAFVIPTGSMAETLLGYNKLVTCPQCGFEYPVNSSNEVDPSDGGAKRPVIGACCPNCRFQYMWVGPTGKPLPAAPGNRSGDRVLVHKALYEFGKPTRGDVVVFKYPVDPQVNQTAQNYIKRLWGLGGETIAIANGDLYRTDALTYPTNILDPDGKPKYPRPADPLRQWEGAQARLHSKTHPEYQPDEADYTYNNADDALQLFESSRRAGFTDPKGFTLIRKPDALALSMRRIVYDNDHQSQYLADKGVPARWSPDAGAWKQGPDDAKAPKTYTLSRTRPADQIVWLRYAHRISGRPTPVDQKDPDDLREFDENGRPRVFQDDWKKVEGGYAEGRGLFAPSPITNFLGYNAGTELDGHRVQSRSTGDFWVGDLMLECTAQVSGPSDAVVLELSKGANRFQARFADGKVTIVRVGPGGKEMATRPTRITSAGKYDLRFANFDCRLRVWVNGTAIEFGADADYSPSDADGYQFAVGAVAGGAVGPCLPPDARSSPSPMPTGPAGFTLTNDILAPAGVGASGAVTVSKLVLWEDTFFTPAENKLYADPEHKVDTFYVHPGHYLCLGDNSGQSSDSRKWGLVPERLMLGKAVFVFFPLSRIGFIR